MNDRDSGTPDDDQDDLGLIDDEGEQLPPDDAPEKEKKAEANLTEPGTEADEDGDVELEDTDDGGSR